MKKAFKLFGAVVAAALLISFTASAAQVGVATLGSYPATVVNSALGATGTNTYAVGGLYTQGITNGIIETNLVQLTSGSGKTVSLQFTAAATAATVSNIVFTITSATAPVAITNSAILGTNSVNVGIAQATQPRSTFATVTMALNGTTPVTTNVVYSINTTPQFGGGATLYLEKIDPSTTITGYVTNYSVVVGEQK